jgi:Concanavalin A-like lectin/glucanases superfamily
MGQNYGPKIITSGLTVNLDAANSASYPGSGSNWYNLGSAGGYVSQGGAYMPSWTTLAGVTCFNFTQVGSYFINNSLLSSFPNPATALTIDVWFYPAASELSSGDRGNLCRANNGNAFYMSWNKSSQVMSNYWYGKINEGYHESGASVSRGTWNNFVAVWYPNIIYQYTNNTQTSSNTYGFNANTTNGLEIGWEGDSRQFSGGIASIKIYGRALHVDEINQNYRISKKRYNLP